MVDHPALSPGSAVVNQAPIIGTPSTGNRQKILGEDSPAAAATRVAQASAVPSTKMPDDSQIMSMLFPGEMQNIKIEKFSKVPSELIKPETDFYAWTNSDKKIFVKEKPDLDEFERIFVLYHEGLHIRQFLKNGSPDLFQNMLKYETLAYGKSVGWLDTEQAKKISIGRKGYASTVTRHRKLAATVFRIAGDAADQHISVINDGFSPAEIDQIYLEAMIDSRMLPDKYSDLEEFTRYEIGDLYKKTGKSFFSLD